MARDVREVTLKHDRRGVPYVREFLGTDLVTRAPIRPYKSFRGMSDEEALAAAVEFVSRHARAAGFGAPLTLSRCLLRYIEVITPNVSPNTVKTYRSALRCCIDPTIGGCDPDDVSSVDIEGLYLFLGENGGRHGDGVGAARIVGLHWFLSGAWKWMVGARLASANPMPAVSAPVYVGEEARALDGAEYAALKKVLDAAMASGEGGDRAVFRRNVAMAARIALGTGERCGELCANLRSDFSAPARNMHVGATAQEDPGRLWRRPRTKGGKSRNISLGGDLCADIERHVKWQATYLPPSLKRSRRVPLLADAEGGLLRPSKVSAEFSAMCAEAGLDAGVTFHTLRHTHASWLLADGWDLKSVSERLGHAKESTTLAIYAHLRPGRDKELGEAIDRITERMGEDYD